MDYQNVWGNRYGVRRSRTSATFYKKCFVYVDAPNRRHSFLIFFFACSVEIYYAHRVPRARIFAQGYAIALTLIILRKPKNVRLCGSLWKQTAVVVCLVHSPIRLRFHQRDLAILVPLVEKGRLLVRWLAHSRGIGKIISDFLVQLNRLLIRQL